MARLRFWLGDESAPYLLPTDKGLRAFAEHFRALSREAGLVAVDIRNPMFARRILYRCEHLMPYVLRWAQSKDLLGGTAWASMIAEAAMRDHYGLDLRLDALCSFPWALGVRKRGQKPEPLRYYDDVRWRPATHDEAREAIESCREPARWLLGSLRLTYERHGLFKVLRERPPSAFGARNPENWHKQKGRLYRETIGGTAPDAGDEPK